MHVPYQPIFVLLGRLATNDTDLLQICIWQRSAHHPTSCIPMFSPVTLGQGCIPCKEVALGSQYVLPKDSLRSFTNTAYSMYITVDHQYLVAFPLAGGLGFLVFCPFLYHWTLGFTCLRLSCRSIQLQSRTALVLLLRAAPRSYTAPYSVPGSF